MTHFQGAHKEKKEKRKNNNNNNDLLTVFPRGGSSPINYSKAKLIKKN